MQPKPLCLRVYVCHCCVSGHKCVVHTYLRSHAGGTVRLQDVAPPARTTPHVDISSPTATALADRRARIQAVVKVSCVTVLQVPTYPSYPSNTVVWRSTSLHAVHVFVGFEQSLAMEDRTHSWVRQDSDVDPSPPAALVSLANRRKRSDQPVTVAASGLAGGSAAACSGSSPTKAGAHTVCCFPAFQSFCASSRKPRTA